MDGPGYALFTSVDCSVHSRSDLCLLKCTTHTHLQVFADESFDHISVLLHGVRYIASNSHSPSTGFGKFITFGLPDKISESVTSFSAFPSC